MKLDLRNNINSVDHLIETCICHAPSDTRLAHLADSKPSIVLADSLPIEPATAIQQGDRRGLLLFALAVDHTARSVMSKFNVWHLDDATITDDGDSVVTDIISIKNSLFISIKLDDN